MSLQHRNLLSQVVAEETGFRAEASIKVDDCAVSL